MNKHSSIKSTGSLLERASEAYDFRSALSGNSAPAVKPIDDEQKKTVPHQEAPQASVAAPQMETPAPSVVPHMQAAPRMQPAAPVQAKAVSPAPTYTPAQRRQSKPLAQIDRAMLSDNNFINPDGPVSGLSEEFRIVKRQLLLSARGGNGYDVIENGSRILICSAHPNEGKTYSAVNLALSIAKEQDNRVLLVDADFAKPSVLKTLDIEPAKGFMDVLADTSLDIEDLVIETDIDGLSILPAGEQTNLDTEYLASARTEQLLAQLTANDPSRIIIFDSPPALAASPASVLALHVGQCLVVVKADETTDSALRDALNLLAGCENIQLLLNRVKFSPTGRKFGSYYGYGA